MHKINQKHNKVFVNILLLAHLCTILKAFISSMTLKI